MVWLPSTLRTMCRLPAGPRSLPLLALAALAIWMCAAPASALSPEDGKCLACHKSEGMQKTLANGESLSLHINADKFGTSVHAMFGCAACHSDVDLSKHPGDGAKIESSRSFSVMRAQVCTTCHTDQAAEWKHGVHAALVREGNPLAPVCTSCHSPHAVVKGVAQAMDTVPCKTCHGDIFAAYSTSVHGVIRHAGITQAPLCFTCHGAHDVKVPYAGAGMNGVCLGCHKEALAKHQEWLPNTQLHFEVINCPVCHAPKAHRKVDLILFNTKTNQDAPRPIGVPEFDNIENASATSPAGVDPATIFKLLQALNARGDGKHMAVRGRLDVQTGEQAHHLMVASEAIRDCKTCHQAGASAFQSVTVSVAGPAGIPERYDVNKDVLKSMFSLNSIGGFYAIGGTRITLFDVLLILALLAGFGVPALHIGVRWLSHRPEDKHRKNGEK